MKKLIFSLFLFLSFSTLVRAQIDATINTTAIGLGATSTSTNYKFTYQNNSIPHYGVSWFVDQDQTGGAPMGYLSGFAGLKFFTGGSVKMLIHNNGNVGIGTTTPNTKLDVNGAISMGGIGYFSSSRVPANDYTNLFLGGSIKDNADGTYTVLGDGASNYFSAIRMDNGTSNGNAGAINFYSGPSVGGTAYTINNTTLFNNYLQMRIAGGNVSIGTSDSKGYKLAVNGSMIATSVTVKAVANWPDYVFKKDYQLPSLQAVKAYIDQNQHLPEIPSEQQIAKEGLNLGEMNKLLMKKVEELTLYLIDLKTEKDKQAQAQQAEIDELKTQMKKLIKH